MQYFNNFEVRSSNFTGYLINFSINKHKGDIVLVILGTGSYILLILYAR